MVFLYTRWNKNSTITSECFNIPDVSNANPSHRDLSYTHKGIRWRSHKQFYSLISYWILTRIIRSFKTYKKGTDYEHRAFLNKRYTYTLENLINKKSVRVHINRLVSIIFDPKRDSPQSVITRDIDEFHIEMILSHKGRSTSNSRSAGLAMTIHTIPGNLGGTWEIQISSRISAVNQPSKRNT